MHDLNKLNVETDHPAVIVHRTVRPHVPGATNNPSD